MTDIAPLSSGPPGRPILPNDTIPNFSYPSASGDNSASDHDNDDDSQSQTDSEDTTPNTTDEGLGQETIPQALTDEAIESIGLAESVPPTPPPKGDLPYMYPIQQQFQPRKGGILLVSIPVNLSAPSSSAPSPVRSRTVSSLSQPPSSSASANSSNLSNVKFAPLPELAPRKRKSQTPLGIAARSAMMRKRRGAHGNDLAPGGSMATPNGMWTQEELDAYYARHRDYFEQQLQQQQQQQQQRQDLPSSPAARPEDEDPFLALGKMVKGAWKKMGGKKGKGAPQGSQEVPVVVATTQDSTLPALDTTSTPNPPLAESPSASNDAESGRVWEEAVGMAVEYAPRQQQEVRNSADIAIAG